MSDFIYAVQGQKGEYSDHQEWIVCAFEEFKKAQELVKELSELMRETLNYVTSAKAQNEKIYYWDFKDTEQGQNWLKEDPEAKLDLNGVNYSIHEIILRK